MKDAWLPTSAERGMLLGQRGVADSHCDDGTSLAPSGDRRYEPSLVLRKWGGGTKVRCTS